VPELKSLSISYDITKNGKAVRFRLGDYRLVLSTKTGGRYTLTIWSKTRSTEQALADFPNSQELAAHGSADSNRRARIPMSTLDAIMASIREFKAQKKP